MRIVPWPIARLTLVAIFLIVAAAADLRIGIIKQGRLTHPDEILAPAVLKHMTESGSLDTNWKLADLPFWFKSPQYNFSGYFVAVFELRRLLHALVPKSLVGEELRELRYFTVIFALAGLLTVAAIGLSIGGEAVAIVAALLASASPSLLMDGFYARPDALYVFLSLVLLLVYLRRELMPRGWLAIAALLIGFLVSIKASALVFAMLLLPGIAQGWIRGSLIAAAGIAIGFAAGAPGALMHPGDYVEGLDYLRRAYAYGIPPHGAGRDSTLVERVVYGATWLWQTWAIIPLLVALGAWRLASERRWDALYAFTPFALTIAYFVTTPTFIERNLAPGLSAMCVLAGLGTVVLAERAQSLFPGARGLHAASVAAVAASMLFVPVWVSAKVVQAATHPYDRVTPIFTIGKKLGRDVLVVSWSRPPWDRLPLRNSPCDPPIIEVDHASDRETIAWLAEGKANGWVVVSRHDSIFTGYVPSTFHTYLEGSQLFLMKREDASRTEASPKDTSCGGLRWL